MTISIDRLRQITSLILIGVGIAVSIWRTDEAWETSFRCRCGDLYTVAPEDHFQREIGKTLLLALPTGIALFIHPMPGLVISIVSLAVLSWIDRMVGYGFPNSSLWHFLRATTWVFFAINIVAVLMSLFDLWVRRTVRTSAMTPVSTIDTPIDSIDRI